MKTIRLLLILRNPPKPIYYTTRLQNNIVFYVTSFCHFLFRFIEVDFSRKCDTLTQKYRRRVFRGKFPHTPHRDGYVDRKRLILKFCCSFVPAYTKNQYTIEIPKESEA